MVARPMAPLQEATFRHNSAVRAIRCGLVLLTSSLAAFACGSSSKAPGPAPKFGAFGFDTAGMDTNVRPGHDFFRRANGAWLDATEIPADRANYSLRLAMTEATEQRTHDLLEAAAATAGTEPADTPGKAGAFYRSFMDEARIEALGAAPLEPELAAARAARTRGDLATLMGRSSSSFHDTVFRFYIDVDLKDTSRYAVFLNQSGLVMPDCDMYLEKDFAAKKAAFHVYVSTLLGRLRWPDADARAGDIVDFETAIAAASWTSVQARDQEALYNPMTIAELEAFAPEFPWRAFLAGAHLEDAGQVIVGEKSAFKKIAGVFGRTPIPVLQAWTAFRAADNAATLLSTPFANAYFEFRQKTLAGQQQQAPRWKRAVNTVSGLDFLTVNRLGFFGTMGWAVGEMFTAKYFPPETKRSIDALAGHLKAAFRARLERLDWMEPQTRVEALKKLDTYTIKVGYPDHARDYSSLTIRADDLVGNVRRAGAADWAFYRGRLHGPVDKSDWAMTPQTNDAYNGSLRDIVFPAGILQPPMFDAAADSAINYGAAGAVIGHELIHGFDDQGRKLDASGALRDWWTAKDAATFQARASVLAAQYSTFEPFPGVKVNGQLTLGENIADLGGLTLALDAYHASLGGRPAPVIDGVTGDQRVLLGWAQAWRGKRREALARSLLLSDPHAPGMYRVNGVMRNLDVWYDAFGVKPGDRLYLPPADRVRIW